MSSFGPNIQGMGTGAGHMLRAGAAAVVSKENAPGWPLQSITGGIGVRVGDGVGVRVGDDVGVRVGTLAPPGVSQRLNWMLVPTVQRSSCCWPAVFTQCRTPVKENGCPGLKESWPPSQETESMVKLTGNIALVVPGVVWPVILKSNSSRSLGTATSCCVVASRSLHVSTMACVVEIVGVALGAMIGEGLLTGGGTDGHWQAPATQTPQGQSPISIQ